MTIGQLEVAIDADGVRVRICLRQTPLHLTVGTDSFGAHPAVMRPFDYAKGRRARLALVEIVELTFMDRPKLHR